MYKNIKLSPESELENLKLENKKIKTEYEKLKLENEKLKNIIHNDNPVMMGMIDKLNNELKEERTKYNNIFKKLKLSPLMFSEDIDVQIICVDALSKFTKDDIIQFCKDVFDKDYKICTYNDFYINFIDKYTEDEKDLFTDSECLIIDGDESRYKFLDNKYYNDGLRIDIYSYSNFCLYCSDLEPYCITDDYIQKFITEYIISGKLIEIQKEQEKFIGKSIDINKKYKNWLYNQEIIINPNYEVFKSHMNIYKDKYDENEEYPYCYLDEESDEESDEEYEDFSTMLGL
tara:strand:+ start:398 stop:1261 length:864 start_codon:yes stop_codon:yes gene_type:complete